jgi:hypothetical protein
MTQAPAAIFKIPTESPQPARTAARPARKAKAARPAPGRVLANGTGRATRGGSYLPGIKTSHTQQIVNAAPTSGEGDRVHRMISALVSVGLEAGYLANPRLAKAHWQAGDRELPATQVTVAGKSALWVDPAEIAARQRHRQARPDAGRRAARRAGRAGGQHRRLQRAAWGELAALTIGQVGQADRVITVDRKVVEVAGHLYVEAPRLPEVPPDDLPAPHPGRLPARRTARRQDRGGPRRAGGRDGEDRGSGAHGGLPPERDPGTARHRPVAVTPADRAHAGKAILRSPSPEPSKITIKRHSLR